MAETNAKLKRKSVAAEFMKKTVSHIIGATGDYISDSMPTIGSFTDEARRSVSKAFELTRNVATKTKSLGNTSVFKGLLNWYLEKESSLDDNFDLDSQLDFDVSTDNEATIAQISETAKSSKEISKSVVESSHKLAETQLASTASIVSSIEGLSAITTSGFERINTTLNDILKVVTKNTATLIEATVASANREKNYEDDLINRKFNFRTYREKVIKDLQNSPLGIFSSLIGTAGSMAKMTSPRDAFKMAFEIIGDKIANSSVLMKEIDKTVSDTVLGGLIRLHGKGNNFFTRALSNIFGIDTTRQAVSTSRARLEVKNVPFDSLTRESIIHAIPGYLRKILVAVGGEDVVYDNRSRTFRTKKAITGEFRELASTRNISRAAGRKFQDLGSYEEILLDLIATREGWHYGGSGASRIEFSKMLQDKNSIRSYMDDLLSNARFPKSTQKDRTKANEAFINRLYSLNTKEQEEFYNAIARETLNRKERLKSFIDEANKFETDLSDIKDSEALDFGAVLRNNGFWAKSRGGRSSARVKDTFLTGVNYTNSALYEIYRRLDEGINVFQVGSKNERDRPFTKFEDSYLPPPQMYRPKPIKSSGGRPASILTYSGNSYLKFEDQEYDENGEPKFTIDEKTGKKVPVMKKRSNAEVAKSWAKNFGSNFMGAIFSGDPKRLQDVVLTSFKDFATVSTKLLGEGLKTINRKGGNAIGYLRHMMTGKGYSYISDYGEEVKIADNEKGGIVGYVNELIFGPGGVKKAASNLWTRSVSWFKSVAGYFDYSGKDRSLLKVKDKRRRLIGASVGAFVGSKIGIIGGPIGILLGAVAGDALAQSTGIGGKIKEFLFGSDEVDKEGNYTGRRKIGYINKAINWIVDPIRYQIGKTFTTFSSVLRKNILGPLSDLGYAIKERMSNAVADVTKQTFGPIIKAAKWIFQKALIAPLALAAKGIAGSAVVKGNVARAGMNISGGLFGGVVSSAASLISDRKTRKAIRERAALRNAQIDVDRAKSGYFGEYEIEDAEKYIQLANMAKAAGNMDSYKENMQAAADLKRTGGRARKLTGRFKDYSTWKRAQDNRRMRLGGVSEYIGENIEEKKTPVVQATEEVAKNTAAIASSSKDLKEFIESKSEDKSFAVHDAKMEKGIEKLVYELTGKKITPDETTSGTKSKRLSKNRRKELKKQYLANLKNIDAMKEYQEKYPDIIEMDEDISYDIVRGTEIASFVLLNPFIWLGRSLKTAFKGSFKYILSPILDIGNAIKTTIIGGKTSDGEKVEGLVPMLYNSTIGAILNQVKSTFTTITKSIAYNILDPIRDMFWVAKEKVKKKIGNFLFGVKDKYGRWVSRGLFSPITDALDSAKNWMRDKIKSFFTTILNPITKLAGGILRAPITAPFALIRMLATGGSREGRENIRSQWRSTVGARRGLSKIGGFFDFLDIGGSKDSWDDREEQINRVRSINDQDIARRLYDRQRRRAIRRGDLARFRPEEAPTLNGEPPREIRNTTEERKRADNTRRQNVATSVAGAIIAGATAGGVNRQEQIIGERVLSDSIKGRTTSESLISNVRRFFRANKEVKGAEGKGGGTPWWMSLLGGLKDIVFDWKTWLFGGALYGLLNDNFRSIAGGIVSTIGTMGGKILEVFGNIVKSFSGGGTGGGSGSVADAAAKAMDINVDNPTDLINPAATVYHTETDAAGNKIPNTVATNAKNSPWYAALFDIAKRGVAKAASSVSSSAAELSKGPIFSKVTKKAFGGMTRLVKGALVSQGVGSLVEKGVSALGEKLGLSEVASNIAGKVTNALSQVIVIKGMITGKGLGAKAIDIVDLFIEKLTWAIKTLGGKLAEKFPKLKGITAFLDKLLKKVTRASLKGLEPLIGRVMTVETTKAGAAVVTAGITLAAFTSIGALIGGFNTSTLFGIPDDEANVLMMSIAAGLGAAFDGIPYIGLVEIFDLVLMNLMDGKGLRQLLAEYIYKASGGTDDLAIKQGIIKDALDKYNKRYGKNLTLQEYLDMINPGYFTRVWQGDTHVDRNTGEARHHGGLKQTVAGWFSSEQSRKNQADQAVNAAEIASQKVHNARLWELENRRISARNNNIKFDTENLSDTEKEMIKELDTMTDAQYNQRFNHEITGRVENQSVYRYRTEGTRSSVEDPSAQSENEWMKSREAYGLNNEDFLPVKKSAAELQKEAEIADRKARILEKKNEWWKLELRRQEAQKRGERYQYQNEEEARMGQWLDSLDDDTFDDIFNEVSGYWWDNASVGRYREPDATLGKGGEDDAGVDTVESKAPSSSISSGKIPSPFLGGGYRMSSPYGPRVLKGTPGFHSGVDLVGSKKEIGAVSEGVVTRVYGGETRNASQGGRSYGNFVEYKTPEGYTVMNAHMKHGSIPSDLKAGTKLSPGDYIGTEGDTGHSYGSHLHFEIQHPNAPKDVKGKHTIDPAKFLTGSVMSNTGKFTPGGNTTADSSIAQSSSIISGSDASSTPFGDLGKIFSVIELAGKKFLSKITGGLLFGDLEEGSSNKVDPQFSTISDFTGNNATEGNVLYLGNEEVRKLNLSAGVADILDLKSGIVYKIYWEPPVKHTDYTPMTEADTASMKKITREWSWIARPVILKINGKSIAAATSLYPHGRIIGNTKSGLTDSTTPPLGKMKWELGGHFCLWYKDSDTNHPEIMSESYCEGMREACKQAYELSKLTGNAIASPGYISGGTDNESRIFDFFSAKGLSPAAIAAIMGTIKQESNFDPKAIQKTKNGPGKGRGLFQWETGGRFEELKKFAASRGTNWDDLDTQLEFAWKELQNSDFWFRKGAAINWKRKGIEPYADGIKGFFADTDIEHAARAFDAAYTRSADAYSGYTENGAAYKGAGRLDKRVAKAKEMYAKWAAKSEASTRTASIHPVAPKADGVGGPEVSAIVDELYRDRSLDDEEGGIGGPMLGLPFNQIESAFNKEMSRAQDRIASINMPSALKSGLSSALTNTASKLRFPDAIREIPTKLNRFMDNTNTPTYDVSQKYTEFKELGDTITNSMNTQNMEALLQAVLNELRMINGNTAVNSDLMTAINDKSDRASTAMKDTFRAMAKNTKRQYDTRPKARDVGTVGAIIRGV